MRVTFIENNDSFSWNVIDLLPVSREQVAIVRGGTAEAARAVRDSELVVIGPGPTDPERAGLVGLVLLAAERRVPVLGICLGHQAIGLAFGASLVRTRPAHGQVAACRFEPSRSFDGVEGVVEVMRYHSLSLDEVRAPLRVIARAAGLVMGVEHETLPIAGLQFHPDSYATPDGRRLVEAFFNQSSLPEGRGSGRGAAAPAAHRVEREAVARGERTALRLSDLDARESFALLGPGYTGDGWALLDFADANGAQSRLSLCGYGEPSPRELRGVLTPVELELDVAPAGLPVELDERGFLDGVERIRSAVAAGDVYQVNLTQRAKVTCESGARLLSTLCRRGVPRFAAWVKAPGLELVSASPELLFEVDGRAVHVEPMKGTAAPHRRAWLEASEKDRAELAMITDLLRDDLQRLCVPGSVAVENARRFIELPYALQTVSDVRGQLRDDVGLPQLLGQLHPGGSVTGAPRAAACEVISQLERTPRGLYCGALGLVDAEVTRTEREGPGERRSLSARFSLLIRTATRTGPRTWEYGVGSGITWESDAVMELEELRLKLGALA